MSQILESVRLALASIWANKLRSLLTLLGNIVAVSSIITVVALITGVNEAVSDAIVSDLGADSFVINRTGITQNEDEFERQMEQPRRHARRCRGGPPLRHLGQLGHGPGAAKHAAWPIGTRSSNRSRCRA